MNATNNLNNEQKDPQSTFYSLFEGLLIIIGTVVILGILVFVLHNSSNNLSNHAHDGTYEFTMMGIQRSIVLDGNNATSSNSISGTTKSEVKQFEDRVEYIEENGNTSIYYFLKNGDLKVSDYIIFHKVK